VPEQMGNHLHVIDVTKGPHDPQRRSCSLDPVD
jgi:hypothetical protein